MSVPTKAKPGGPLAKARQEAHRHFDLLWKFGHMTRHEAYRWLTYAMHWDPYTTAHISQFSKAECAKVIELMKRYWEEEA